MLDDIHWVSVSVSHNYIINEFLARIAIVSRAAFRDNRVHLPWNTHRVSSCGLSRKPYRSCRKVRPRNPSRSWKMHEASSDDGLSRHTIGGPSAILTFHDGILPKIEKESLYFEIQFFFQHRTVGIMKPRWQILSRIPYMFTHFTAFLTWLTLALFYAIYFNSDLGQFIQNWMRAGYITQRAASLSCVRDKTGPVPRLSWRTEADTGRKNISKRSNYMYARILARKTHSHAYARVYPREHNAGRARPGRNYPI